MPPNNVRVFSFDERRDIWRRWQRGEATHQIAGALGRRQSSIRKVLVESGGIAPIARRRATHHLSIAEREEISRGLAQGLSLRGIARLLDRPTSTVSREVARNGGVGAYRAAISDHRAWDRARRPKQCKLSGNAKLRRIVSSKLQRHWSPEQISGWLACEYPDKRSLQVSHETIYRTLFVRSRGALKKELLGYLRSKRTFRRSKKSRPEARAKIVDAVSIRERPVDVEDRAVPGHWEGDLLCGREATFIATLVERLSRFTMLVKLNARDAATVNHALKVHMGRLPEELCRTLTWDRGFEMAKHKEFTLATGVKVYFCDPKSPWQRGSNENTNRLLRQYLPKARPIHHSQAQLNRIARELNGRPRKTLGFRTPADVLKQALP